MRKYFVIILLIFNVICFAAELPKSYNSDVDELLYVSPVRQQEGGSCWAFSACSAMESNNLKKNHKLLLFNSMDMFRDNPYPQLKEEGGSYLKVMPYLSNLWGPVIEGTKEFSPMGYCENCELITDEEYGFTKEELERVKTGILDNGALVLSMYMDEEFFNNKQTNYFCPEKLGNNHAVVMVGWNDDYPKSNFANEPERDGAFLIKNSWGTDSHNKGFFWISYCDPNLNKATSYDFILKELCPYNKYLSYCKSAASLNRYYSDETKIFGKIEIKSDRTYTIYALRNFINQPNVKVECKIYINSLDEKGYKGEIKTLAHNEGYKTTYFKQPIDVNYNDKIIMVLSYETENENAFLPLETSIYGYTPGLVSNTNFISLNGEEWKEITNNIGAGLLVGNGKFALNIHEIDMEINHKFQLKGTYEKANCEVIWKSSDENIVSVDENGVIISKNPGYSTISGTYNGLTDVCDVYVY